MTKRIAYRTCPSLRSDVRARAAPRGRRDRARARRPRRRVQSRLPVPEGHRDQAARGRPRPAAHAADPRAATTWREVTWDEAFAEIERAPRRDPRGARQRRGRGRTSATRTRTTSARRSYNRVLLQALGTPNVYSASTVDQMPKQVSAGLMFGAALTVPVPDVDRTDYLLMLGANPFASNGSLLTAPDLPGRLAALRRAAAGSSSSTRAARRPPRRPTSTSPSGPAPTHCSSSRSSHVLFAEDLVDLGALRRPRRRARRRPRAAAPIHARSASRRRTGIDADTIRRIARELATAPAAAVYGRIGTCTQEFGTLASWLVDVLNVLTGNLDRPGGAMFTKPAAGGANTGGNAGQSGRGVRFGRRHSRACGACPRSSASSRSSASPRRSRRRATVRSAALITIAGNPVLSTPDSDRLDRALASLDFMVSVDIYRNETTRHADVILPGRARARARPLRHRALQPRDPQRRQLLAAARRARPGRARRVADPAAAGRDPRRSGRRRRHRCARRLRDHRPRAEGGDAQRVERRRPRRRRAPEGARVGAAVPSASSTSCCAPVPTATGSAPTPTASRSRVLEANPHGIDFGPLQPRIPEVLRTPTRQDRARAGDDPRRRRPRLRAALDAPPPRARARRPARPALEQLVDAQPRRPREGQGALHPARPPRRRGPTRVSPTARRPACARPRASVVVPVEITDAIMPGVVSLPHGWGHDRPGTRMSVAAAHAGANSNVLAARRPARPALRQRRAQRHPGRVVERTVLSVLNR